MRSGFSSQLHLYILNKTWFFSCDRIPKQAIYVPGFSTSQNRVAPIGIYDGNERTYCLNAVNLIQNINVLWLSRQFCPDELVRAEVSPLPLLSPGQAKNLFTRLGNPDLVFPRLQVPFQIWSSLLEHGGWRQNLYEKRQGLSEQWSIQQWLQIGISSLGQQLGWKQSQLQPVPEMAGTRGGEVQILIATVSRQLAIAGNPYQLHIFSQDNPSGQIWRFELRSLLNDSFIPEGFTLRLLTEDLQPFENNTHRTTTDSDYLYVEVMLEAGEGLVWEIEPIPEDYDREILRF